MPVVFVDQGLLDDLLLTANESDGVWELGLYQNNWTPAQGDDISDVTVATFSGYSGLELLQNWSSPTIIGTRASMTADAIVQSHSGGGTSNNIYGYYVVDGSGVLMYAERDPSGPRLMGASGDVYTVVPKLTKRSEP